MFAKFNTCLAPPHPQILSQVRHLAYSGTHFSHVLSMLLLSYDLERGFKLQRNHLRSATSKPPPPPSPTSFERGHKFNVFSSAVEPFPYASQSGTRGDALHINDGEEKCPAVELQARTPPPPPP